jgi:hypothetical protein
MERSSPILSSLLFAFYPDEPEPGGAPPLPFNFSEFLLILDCFDLINSNYYNKSIFI